MQRHWTAAWIRFFATVTKKTFARRTDKTGFNYDRRTSAANTSRSGPVFADYVGDSTRFRRVKIISTFFRTRRWRTHSARHLKTYNPTTKRTSSVRDRDLSGRIWAASKTFYSPTVHCPSRARSKTGLTEDPKFSISRWAEGVFRSKRRISYEILYFLKRKWKKKKSVVTAAVAGVWTRDYCIIVFSLKATTGFISVGNWLDDFMWIHFS